MKTSNAMQLKAAIKRKAVEANVTPQLILQNYVLERLLVRISLSSWRDRVIVKGGMLIGSLIGVDKRATRDLDTLFSCGFPRRGVSGWSGLFPSWVYSGTRATMKRPPHNDAVRQRRLRCGCSTTLGVYWITQ